MAKSKNVVAPVVASSVTVTSTPVVEVKADKARVIFAEVYAMEQVPARKDIIARCVAEAGLTKAGAATYLQIYRKKNNMVATKASVVVA